MYKIFIIAGEESGDKLGADLMQRLSTKVECQFYGVGGSIMLEQGIQQIFPMHDINIMGFLEVAPHIPRLLNRINLCAQKIREIKPDLVITIDSPDFCFRVVEKICQEFKTAHYVAPTVWAYRPKRAQYIARLYDLLLTLFPFEPPYFERCGLKTLFVGHDITKKPKGNKERFRKKYRLTTEPILTLNMGSRWGEVRKMGPIFVEAAHLFCKEYPKTKIIIPSFSRFTNYIQELTKNLPSTIMIITVASEKDDAFAATDIAICKSGTISLEVAHNKTAMVIAHKVNFLSAMIFRFVYLQKYITLLNISAGKELIPELLQERCNPKLISEYALNLYKDPKLRAQQIKATTAELNKFSANGDIAADSIITLLTDHANYSHPRSQSQ